MMERLTIDAPSEGLASIQLDDVRDRAARGECDEWAVAGLTLIGGGEGETWGEFFDLEDVEKLHAWTGKLLAEARENRRPGLTRTV